MRACVWRAVLCQPALGSSRLPSGHSDGKKVENKWFCSPGLVSLKEKSRGLAGCVCSESHLLPFFPTGAAGAWQPLGPCAGCGIEGVRLAPQARSCEF